MHSCPERVSFLLESVSGVDKADADFTSQKAKVQARGDLCTIPENREVLLKVLQSNRYGGTILDVRIR